MNRILAVYFKPDMTLFLNTLLLFKYTCAFCNNVKLKVLLYNLNHYVLADFKENVCLFWCIYQHKAHAKYFIVNFNCSLLFNIAFEGNAL